MATKMVTLIIIKEIHNFIAWHIYLIRETCLRIWNSSSGNFSIKCNPYESDYANDWIEWLEKKEKIKQNTK